MIRLRALNLAPKQIARQLSLRPAEVNTILRMQAANLTEAQMASGEVTRPTRFIVNSSAARHLLSEKKNDSLSTQDKADFSSGYAQVFATWVEGNKYTIFSYLVDYYCLGVKDTFGPKKVDRLKYETMIDAVYSNMSEAAEEIMIEQAQAIVFGAIDYAANLGFKPHADFEKSKVALGQRLDNLQPIEFGSQGKPLYISEPYDNPDKILATLRSTVGEGNFNYMSGLSPFGLF